MLDGLLNSKRFWLTIASVIFTVLSSQLGLPISEDQVTAIVLIIASWIVGDSLRSTRETARSRVT